MSPMKLLPDMLSLRQKALATLVILGMNLAVFLFMGGFVVLSLIPSLVFLVVLLQR